MRRVWNFLGECCCCICSFFLEREIFENGISWLIDWLVVFCWNKFEIGVEIFWKKKMTVIFVFLLIEKETSFENNGLIKIEWYKQPQIKHVVVIVCWWCLFCFENRGRFDVVAFVFLKEDQVYLCNYSMVVFILIGYFGSTPRIFLVIDGFSSFAFTSTHFQCIIHSFIFFFPFAIRTSYYKNIFNFWAFNLCHFSPSVFKTK